MLSAAPSMSAGLELIATLRQAVTAVEALLADARRAVAARVSVDGRPVPRTLDREQRAAHGLAWLATYVEAIRQLSAYAERLMEAAQLGEIEDLLVRIGAGEYLAQILGGIPMSQGEIVRLSDLGLSASAVAARVSPAVEQLIATGNTAPHRARLAELMREQQGATVGACGLDETLDAIREEMRKFADDKVVPHAQAWHLRNQYIPLEVIAQMSELGVFSLTIPEDYGGMGLGKESMCVVSEELSRGYIGVGSLGTRSEIAAELILGSGTAEQKRRWLPKIAWCPLPKAGTSRTPISRSTSSRRCPNSASSISRSPRITAAWGSARSRCVWSPRNCPAAISASARSAPAPKSPPN